MATVTMSLEEYEALVALIRAESNPAVTDVQAIAPTSKRKRSTAYQRKYRKAFKKVSKKYKLKSGKWKKGGFKAAVRAAHKEARK